MKYYIGVDGGASKTEAIVVDENNIVHGRGLAGGSNHLRVGIQEATRNVERAVNKALVEAGVPIRDVEYAYCGIAGIDHPAHRHEVVEALQVFFPSGSFTIDADSRIALTAAVGFGEGIVVVSGTGSIAYGRNRAGEETRAGGWGPTLGDEGSGYWIAREALAAVVRAHDGRGTPTLITDLLCADHDLCQPDDLPRFVYAVTTHADDIAKYGTLVIKAAAQGDPIASDIMSRAGEELAACVVAVARKLGMTSDRFPVGYVGGAFRAGALILDPLRTALNHALPNAHLTPPARSPVEGAALLAIRAAAAPRTRTTQKSAAYTD